MWTRCAGYIDVFIFRTFRIGHFQKFPSIRSFIKYVNSFVQFKVNCLLFLLFMIQANEYQNVITKYFVDKFPAKKKSYRNFSRCGGMFMSHRRHWIHKMITVAI
jgi:hypothetical protein